MIRLQAILQNLVNPRGTSSRSHGREVARTDWTPAMHEALCYGFETWKWTNQILALTEFTVQRRLTITPLLDDAITHIQKKFCGAWKAHSVCLMVPGNGWQRKGHLCHIWKEGMFRSQLPLHLLRRRKQRPPPRKSQFKHSWYLVNCSLPVWEKWLFLLHFSTQTNQPLGILHWEILEILELRQPCDLKLALYYLGTVTCLALQALPPWL